jgi:hypothetical protein
MERRKAHAGIPAPFFNPSKKQGNDSLKKRVPLFSEEQRDDGIKNKSGQLMVPAWEESPVAAST